MRRFALVVLSVLLLVVFASTTYAFFNLPRAVSMKRVMGVDNQMTPFVIYHVRVDEGILPMCLLVLYNETTGQFSTESTHPSACGIGNDGDH